MIRNFYKRKIVSFLAIISLVFIIVPHNAYAAVTYLSLSQVDSSANSGSTSVTVNASTKFAVIYWSGWRDTETISVSSLSLGGVSATILQNGSANSPTDGMSSAGVAIVINPPTGSQTFSYDRSGTNSLDEGATFTIAYFSSTAAPSVYTDVVVDSDYTQWIGSSTKTLTLDAVTGGYVQGVGQSYQPSQNPDCSLNGQSLIVDNHTFNSEGYDVASATVSTPTTDFSCSGDYGTIGAISLKDFAGATRSVPAKMSIMGKIKIWSKILLK